MEQFFLSFLTTSLFMAVIIVAVLALRAFFPKAFSPKMRYVVWIVILLGLAIPFRPLIGDGIVNLQSPSLVSVESQVVPGVAGTGSVGSAPNANITSSTSAGISTQEPLAVSGAESSTLLNLQALSVIEMLVVVWAVVAAAVLLYHVVRHVRFLRLVRRWGSAVEDEKILGILAAVKDEKGIGSKEIALKRCGFISTSMIIGFFRPTILLPEEDFNTVELEMIFHHELVHYRRGDLFVKLLSVIAIALNWFNPAVYLANRAMQADCEASCDQSVIASIGGESKYRYAQTVMKMAGHKAADRAAFSTCFSDDKQGLETRVEAIVNASDNTRKIAIAGLVTSLLTFVLVVGLVVLAGSVFVFGKQDSDSEFVAEAYDADANAFDDFNHFDADASLWDDFPEMEFGSSMTREDGTVVQIVMNKDGSLFVLEGGDITEVEYDPSIVQITLEEAVEIAMEEFESRDIAVIERTSHEITSHDIVWHYGHWVYALFFTADGADKPFIQCYVDVESGNIIRLRNID